MALYMVEKLVFGVIVLSLRGKIVLGEESGAFREHLKRLIEEWRTRIVLDLAEVNYLDSVGLSSLVASYTSARKQGGDLKLLQLTKKIHNLLQITRLSTVFEVYNTLDEAVRSFGPQENP